MSNNGLKVTVEDAKCVQANAFVQSGIFQEFIFKEDSATFRINLNVLLVIKLMLPCLEREGMNLLCKFRGRSRKFRGGGGGGRAKNVLERVQHHSIPTTQLASMG